MHCVAFGMIPEITVVCSIQKQDHFLWIDSVAVPLIGAILIINLGLIVWKERTPVLVKIYTLKILMKNAITWFILIQFTNFV